MTHIVNFKNYLMYSNFMEGFTKLKTPISSFQGFLPREWKSMTVFLRHSHDYKEHTLEKLHGIMKTYELEI